MSRRKPTPEEHVTGEALVAYLREQGQKVSDFQHGDRPDLSLRVNDELVGCECVQVPPARIFRWVHTRFKQLSADGTPFVRVIWPVEPHVWVRNAILAKQALFDEYVKRLGTDQIYLLVHAPVNPNNRSIRYENEFAAHLIRHGAQSTPSDFKRVLFWDPASGVQPLLPKDPPWPKITVDLSKGYPTNHFAIGDAMFRTTEHGEEPRVYEGEVIDPKLIIVKPESPDYAACEPAYKRFKYQVVIEAHATSAQLGLNLISDDE